MRNEYGYYAELKRLVDKGYEYFWAQRDLPPPRPDAFASFKTLYECPKCGKVHPGKHIVCSCGWKGISAFKAD